MGDTLVIKGRVVNSTTVKVEEPLPERAIDVEVVVHLADSAQGQVQAMIDFLTSLPPGARTKEEIERQIEEERNSWRD